MQTQVYLFFDGRCQEALDFYKKALGIEVEMLMRFKDNPDKDKNPQACPPGKEEKVMHALFRLGDQRVMASDGYANGQPEFKGFSLSLAFDSEAEANRLFNALGEGGQIRMPLTKTFFAPKFGMVADKFGVGWMVMVNA
jgi:PhnB protein